MLPVVEAHVDSVMHEPFAFQAFSNACFDHHVHSALLEHACADAMFDVMPAAGFYDDGIDSLQVKQVRKQQSRRPRSDNSDLRAQVLPLDGCQVREERLEFRRAKRRLSTALIAVRNLVWGREENLFVRHRTQDRDGKMCEQWSAFIKLQPAHDAIVLQIFSNASLADAEVLG